MVDVTYPIAVLGAICVALGLVMLFHKDPLTCAMSLLGVLISTAGIYGLLDAHFVATIQLVVYAGAIMVLFVFSVMLLNMQRSLKDFNPASLRFLVGVLASLVVVVSGFFALRGWVAPTAGPWNAQAVLEAGGNTRLLAHSLFTQHWVAFEAVSVALLVALVGAVTLAKRKIG